MTETHTLVIAYGNRLRGDDGVGPAAADIVAQWQLHGVKVRIVHQLTPELADEMKSVERVLFVDAALSAGECPFASRAVTPNKSRRPLAHHETPASLLALLCELEGRAPQAWLLTISAYSFDHGAPLSAEAEDNLQAALAWMRAWVARC